MARALDQLSPRERLVLRFLATFVEVEGYLPSSRLVASECGLRSASSAARIARVLEADGFIDRDPTNPRLATVSLPEPRPPTLAPVDELLLARVTLIEIEAGIDTDHAALAWAPDRDAVSFVHRSALRRTELAQLYDAAATRLEDSGGSISQFGRLALEHAQHSAQDRVALVTSWRRYCLKSALVEDALQAFLQSPRNLRRIHLQAAYEVELVQAAPVHPDMLEDWSGVDADPDLGPFWRAYTKSLQNVLAAMANAVPLLLAQELVPAFSDLGAASKPSGVGDDDDTVRALNGLVTSPRRSGPRPCHHRRAPT
jgi:hypothetical protein